MSTQPVTTPSMTEALQGAEKSLAAGLRALSGASAGNPPAADVPVPEPSPVGGPAASAPTSSAPASVPAPSTPPAATPPAPASVTDPAALRFLEMHKGDLTAALKAGIDYNNRLSAYARAHPEEFKPGGAADPKAPPVPLDQSTPFKAPETTPSTTPPTTPTSTTAETTLPERTVAPVEAQPVPETSEAAPEIQLDWNKISEEVGERTRMDAACTSLVQQWVQRDQRRGELEKEIVGNQQQLAYLNAKLQDPSLSLSEVDQADIKDSIRSLRFELNTSKQERMILLTEQQQLDQQFKSRRNEISDETASRYRSEAQEQVFSQELKETEERALSEMQRAWPAGLERVAKTHAIPTDFMDDFREEAKVAVQARWAVDPNFTFDASNLDSFLSPVAQRFMQRMDKYHRGQSAIYAQQAAQRASSPSPTLPPGVPPPQPPPSRPLTPEEIMVNARGEYAQRLRGFR